MNNYRERLKELKEKKMKNKINISIMFIVSTVLFLILFYDSHIKNMNQFSIENGFGQLSY